VWDSLMRSSFISQDTNLVELLMSLSGTIIVKNNKNGNPEISTPPSKIDSNFIRALLYGGASLPIYRCDEYKKCLNLREETITVSEDKGLVKQAVKMIEQLNMDVLSDSGEISPKVRGFLEMTPIPILKLISTEASLGRPLDTLQYGEVIAISLIDQYLSENIKIVRQALEQEDTPMNHEMELKINSAQLEVTHSLTAAYKKLQNTLLLVTSMRSMEQQLSSRLSNLASIGQEGE